MSDPKDWKDVGDEPSDSAASRPLPPHLDPRRPRGGLPPRPPRTTPPGGARTPPRGPAAAALARSIAPRPAPRPAGRPVTPPPVAPAPVRRRRSGLGTRVLGWVAGAVSFAVLTTSVGGYVLVHRYDAKINRIEGVFDFGDRPQQAASRDARNILIVGSDSRGDAKPGENFQGAGDEFVTGQRSDTVILAHLYGESDKAQLISFPRDSWVTIPEHVDPKTGEVVEETQGKLNKAFFDGGPPLLIQTIEALTRVRVDNYMQIDFDGFQRMVNALGGVEVCLSKPAKEKDSGIDLKAGRQTIQGDQALAFVRQRKGLPNGDLSRIERQQQFIGAIVRKTLSAGTLLNPFKLDRVVGVAAESVEVDRGLTTDELTDLALRFRSFDAGGVLFSTVPIADVNGFRKRQSVVLLDEVAGEAMFEQLRRDVPPDTPDAAPQAAEGRSGPLIVRPGAVRVRVFNGAGTKGLGRKAYDDLAAVGFAVVGSPDNRGTGATSTTVFHGADKADSARTLVAALPGSRAELDPTLTRGTLEVVVGSGYSGAKRVTVKGAAPAPSKDAPTATAAPSKAPVKTAAADPCAP